ncbi:MAG: GDSL-type esterase/lipase family protein, partial [Acidobacteriota bacterium]
PAAAQTVIVAFGDSLTQGFGDDNVLCEGLPGGYPPRLRGRLEDRGIANIMRTSGVCGELTSQAVSRIDVELSRNTDADVMLIKHATNDLSSPSISTQSMLFNVRTMADKALAAGLRPVLIAPVPRAPEAGSNARTGFFALILREEAEANSIDFADGYNGMIGINDLYNRFYFDPFHPNAEGYNILSNIVLEPTISAVGRPVGTGPCDQPIRQGDLLLPYYEVDTTDPNGLTTLWSVRNETESSAQVAVQYFAPDTPQSFQRCELVDLPPRGIKTFDVRSASSLETDSDGVARGYILFRGLEENSDLEGDAFVITPNENFASGQRLLRLGTDDPRQDLCAAQTVRFLLGGGFSGGTTFRIWFEADGPVDPAEQIVNYAVYSEAGGEPVLSAQLPTREAAFEVDIENLLGPFLGTVDFGAVEFTFSGEVGGRSRLGHVSATLDALGAYSVGLEAVCSD